MHSEKSTKSKNELLNCPETVELFKKTLIGNFSCVKTRLAFDKKILKPNLTTKDFNKSSIDDSFNNRKKVGLKVVYRLQLNDEEEYHDCRFVFKILKMGKNNQYDQAMTKRLPTSCIKSQKTISNCYEFDLLIEKVSVEDKIGHLFVVDIKFDKNEARKRECLLTKSIHKFSKKKSVRSKPKVGFSTY